MGFFDQISGMLEQYTSQTHVPREQAHQDYDTIAATVPPNVLGSVIGPALSSLGAGEVEQRIRNSAEQMGPSTRSQFLQKLLNAIGGGGNTASVLSQAGVDPSLAQQPERASADDVAKVAAQVHQSHPDGFNSAMEFYTAHPTLVKVLGTMAIAKIAQHLSAQSRSTH